MAFPVENKKYYRCTVCNDIHFGVRPPEMCPTCSTENAFVEIDEAEAKAIMGHS